MISKQTELRTKLYHGHALNAFSLSLSLSAQEQTKLDSSKQQQQQQVTSPDQDCDDLSPMPQVQVPPVRRRGGISAEPVSEEDATSYVKKVVGSLCCFFVVERSSRCFCEAY